MKFKGWQVGTETKQPGDKITVTDNTEIKAVWEDIEVKVTYDPGDGSGAMTGATLKRGSSYKILENGFTAPENQEFDTWEIDGKKVAAGTEITVTKDTVIKAIWKDIMVNVTYDPGEGSGSMKGESLKKGSTYTLLPNRFKAPDTNMKFTGWLVGNETKQPGDKITVTENTVITAVWENIEVKVSYDANGGEGTMAGKSLKKGSRYTLSENDFTAPAGKEFDGWRVGSKNMKPGDTITVNEDTVIFAKWKDAPATVTFNPGDHGTGGMDPVKVKRGSRYKLPESTFTPKPDYKFKTWRIGNMELKPGKSITIKEDTEIVAVWSKMLTVTYKANDGKWTNGDTERTPEVAENTPFKLESAPKRDDFIFKGWLLEGTDGTPLRAGTEHKGTAEALTFVAQWKKKPSAGGGPNIPGQDEKVTLKLEPGAHGQIDPAKKEQQFPKGKRTTVPEAPTATDENFIFTGWLDQETNTTYQPGKPLRMNRDITLTAQWAEKIQVKYLANGGKWTDGKTEKTQDVAKDQPFTLEQAPKKDGYRFLGWLPEGVQEGTAMRAGSEHRGTSQALTFVAKWKPAPPKPPVTPGTPSTPGTEPGTPPVTPEGPNTPPVTPGTEPDKPSTPGTEPNQPGRPLTPSESGIGDREALLRRMRELWSKRALEQVQEQKVAIPKAGVGAAPSSVEPMLFPVDLLPAPKKREED